MIADVILQKHSLVTDAFSYTVPVTLEKDIHQGMLVEVPFRSGQEKAIVLHIRQEESSSVLKSISHILQPVPVLFPFQLEIATWIAEYYHCPIHKAIDLFLPKYIWENKEDSWVKRAITVTKGEQTATRGKKEKMIQSLLTQPMSFGDIQQKVTGVSMPYLRTLEKKGIINIHEGEIIPPYFSSYNLSDIGVIQERGLKTLTPDQHKVVNRIYNDPTGKYLLHGVTGSGKTEVYLHVAYTNYIQHKQTIILVPEIALTPQLIAYFFRVFGKSISVIHSKLSEGEKFTEWVRIKEKDSFVIIGSRSALFSPFVDLGSIIIDEEHEWTYKSDQNPRYHTRTVATRMSDMLHCSLILGSATPDIETYYAAQKGEYILLPLPKKIT